MNEIAARLLPTEIAEKAPSPAETRGGYEIEARLFSLRLALVIPTSSASQLNPPKTFSFLNFFTLSLRPTSGFKEDFMTRFLGRVFSFFIREESAIPESVATPDDEKAFFLAVREKYLDLFLRSGETLEFPKFPNPEISFVVVLFNRAAMTLGCLRSIRETVTIPYEVILADNASTDETRDLLKRVRGAKIVLNPTNLHYLRACNQAAARANGTYLLFLNNDAELMPNAARSAVRAIEERPDAGAVCGRIIAPDGNLQEAGSIVWQDGSSSGYGRGEDPFSFEYSFRRDVHYGSGAFLLTPRKLFKEMGGFDEDFAPAYYEDADYCLRLVEQGRPVVYEPGCSILHFEHGSSNPEEARTLMARNQAPFKVKHAAYLRSCLPVNPRFIPAARHADRKKPRLLFVDDRVPHFHFGAGSPRTNEIVRSLIHLGFLVTFYPMDQVDESWGDACDDIPESVEMVLGKNRPELERFLEERAGYYSVLFVSRPHNMKQLSEIRARRPELLNGAKIVYDAEAIFCLRDSAWARLNGESVTAGEEEERIVAETRLAAASDAVVAVSQSEASLFRQNGIGNVHVLGHSVRPDPTPADFGSRRDILFVGPTRDDRDPNSDSVRWFSLQVLPRLRSLIGENARFLVVGINLSPSVAKLAGNGIEIVGEVEDLRPYYSSSRVFVVPTRFCAGIPIKLLQTAAYGLPAAATWIVANQLGWRDGRELLASEANDADAFARNCARLYTDRDLWLSIRENALQRIKSDCSPDSFEASLAAVFSSLETRRTALAPSMG